MRDDIHKGAPVASHWRTLMKRCSRDADWEREAPEQARRALVQDLRNYLSGAFLVNLRERVLGRGQLVFGPAGIDMARIKLDASSPIERSFAAHVDVARRIPGLDRKEIFDRAVRSTLNQLKSDNLRAMEAHVFDKFPRDAPEMRRRLRASLHDAEGDVFRSLSIGLVPTAGKRASPALGYDTFDLR